MARFTYRARLLVSTTPNPDIFLFNALIKGCFGGMVGCGVGIGSSSLASMIPAAAELGWLDSEMGIQCLALKSGLHDQLLL
ncbi:hypothetical protein Droror1_Dr00018890 [Drosera rotundifolia]